MKYKIEGLDDISRILEDVGPRVARNLIRTTMHGIAGEVAKQAKENAPEKEKILKKAIKVKRKKSHPDKPVSDVVVTRGRDAKYDAFYWRFVEYGSRGKTGHSAKSFFRKAAKSVQSDFDRIMYEQFGKKLEAALRREAKRNK